MTVSETVQKLSQIEIDQVMRSAKHPRKELEKLITELGTTLTLLKNKIAEQKEQQKIQQATLEEVVATLTHKKIRSYEETAIERQDQFILEKIRKTKQLKLEEKNALECELTGIKENINLFYRERNLLEQKLSQARSRYQILEEKHRQKYFFLTWLKELPAFQLSFSSPSKNTVTRKKSKKRQKSRHGENNGLFTLITINLVIFILDHTLNLKFIDRFYLDHDNVLWYQFITAMFCHANWQHLSSNLFFLYLFGRLVEEEEGAKGLLGSYLICGFGANIMSFLFQPSYIVSLGASGAVFGLFTVSVLLKLGWHWRRLLEVIILGQFVLQQVLFELQNLDRVDGINRVAHVGGALMGVLLICGVKHWQKRTQPLE